MYEREDGRREVAITDIEALVPENHLVRKNREGNGLRVDL